VRIDYRWGASDLDLFRRYAAELVALAPDVIVATAGSIVGALQQASRTVPIVFVTTIDPVGSGFVPPLANIAMRRYAHGGGKCAGEMKYAETRDIGKVGDGDVFSEMLFDVCENTPQPYVIQPMWCQYRQPNELRLGVRMRQPRREQQRRRFHEHAARGGRTRHRMGRT
jgi:hypothetical protein